MLKQYLKKIFNKENVLLLGVSLFISIIIACLIINGEMNNTQNESTKDCIINERN